VSPVATVADPAVGVDERKSVPSRMARWMIAGIRGYQGLRTGRPTGCRYLPTCSEYAAEAIELHGARRGTTLAVGRIARCGPWGGHGPDPVPGREA
jgi:putative membrane protein insertion efficiency factor